MTLTASFKEKLKQAYAVFAWDMKSCTGIFTVYSILAAVFTTIILTLCIVIGILIADGVGSSRTDAFGESIKFFQLIASGMIYFLTIIFTIIYTVQIYSYQHSKRKVDLYGSLPISRTVLFVSKSASAYIFSLVPAMFFLGIIFIISICLGQPITNEAISMYLKLIIGTLACISAYGLISVCCGTTINSVIMFIAVCVVYPLSAMFIKGVIGGFFSGFYSGIFKDNFIMNALNPLAAYDGINIGYWLIFSVVCILVSVYLVKNRKMERAQESFAYYLPCHIMKVLISFLVGMFLGVLFGSLNVFGYGYLGFVFGFILGSVPAFVIAHLIFYKGFSKLLKTSIPLGGLIIAVVAAMALINYDVFGYNEFVPDAENVQSAGFIDGDNYYRDGSDNLNKVVRESAHDFTDKEKIDSVIADHRQIIESTDFSSTKKFQNVWTEMVMDNMPFRLGDFDYAFAYKLDNGRVITRVYQNMHFNSLYYDDINDYSVIKTKEYTQNYTAMMNADLDSIDKVEIKTNPEESCDLYSSDDGKKDCERIIEAFRKDFEADKTDCSVTLAPLKYVDYSYDSVYYGDYDDIDLYKDEYPEAVCLIEVETSVKNYDEDNILDVFNGSISLSDLTPKTELYVIPESYTNTISVLKEIGILNSGNQINEDCDYYSRIGGIYYGY